MKIAGDVKATDFASRVVKSGASIESARPRNRGRPGSPPRTAAAEQAARGAVARSNGAGRRGSRRRQRRPRRRSRGRGRPLAAPARGCEQLPRVRATRRAPVTARIGGPRVDCPPCLLPSRARPCARPTSSAGSTSWGSSALARADRDGVTSWDLRLDGRRRFDLPVTLILDPSLALICWVHFAPPIGDAFRKSYRKLLRWNDEFPFAKFSLAEDERPVLATRDPGPALDRDELGLAIARSLAIADQLLEESASWLWIGGRIPDTSGRTSRGAGAPRALRASARRARRGAATGGRRAGRRRRRRRGRRRRRRAPTTPRPTSPRPPRTSIGRRAALVAVLLATRRRGPAPAAAAPVARRGDRADDRQPTRATSSTRRPRRGPRRGRPDGDEPPDRHEDPALLLRPGVPRGPAGHDRVQDQQPGGDADASTSPRRRPTYTLLRIDFGKQLGRRRDARRSR